MKATRKYRLGSRIAASLVSAAVSLGVAITLYDWYMPKAEEIDGSFTLPGKDGRPLFVIPQSSQLTVEQNRPLSFRMPHLEYVLPWRGELTDEPAYGQSNSPQHHYSQILTDKRGFRNPRSHDQLTSLPVLCIGDSFLEGLTVSNNDLLTSLIERETGIPTYNAGLTTIGLADEMYILRQLSEAIRPSVVLWFLFEGNDFGSPHAQRSTSLRPIDASVFRRESSPLIDPWIFQHPIQLHSEQIESNHRYEGRMLYRYIPQHPFKTRLEEPVLRKFFSEVVRLQKDRGFVVEFFFIPAKGRYMAEPAESLQSRLPRSFGDAEEFRRDVLSINVKLLQDAFMKLPDQQKRQQRKLISQKSGLLYCLNKVFEFSDQDSKYRLAWDGFEVSTILKTGRPFIDKSDLDTFDFVTNSLVGEWGWGNVKLWSHSVLPATIRKLCSEKGLRFTDLTKALQTHPEQPVFVPADTHFSIHGHAAAAKAAISALRADHRDLFVN